MSSSWKVGVGLLTVALVVGLALMVYPGWSPVGAAAQGGGGGGTAKYTVVATDGTHLVVTDNQANMVHFYAIEQGGKPGDELKFRGSINLAEVGKPSIKPSMSKK